MLLLLESYEFIKGAGNGDFVSANEIQEGRIRATALGKRVAQLYLDPYTANHILTCIKRSESKPVTSFGLLQMVSHTIEMRPLLRVKVKEYETIQQAWVKHETDMLMMEPSSFEPEYDDFLNSIRCRTNPAVASKICNCYSLLPKLAEFFLVQDHFVGRRLLPHPR